jgi:hypothetical protein
MCFSNSVEYTYLEKTEHFSTVKQLSCRKYFFHKLSQFSQVNIALDAPVSNIDGYLWRDACVL